MKEVLLPKRPSVEKLKQNQEGDQELYAALLLTRKQTMKLRDRLIDLLGEHASRKDLTSIEAIAIRTFFDIGARHVDEKRGKSCHEA